MEQKSAIQSTTYILAGALLQLTAGLSSGWATALIAVVGFLLFFQGLSKLKTGLDATGQQAVSLLTLAAIIGAIGALVDMIPLMGIFASIAYIGAFVLELVGFLRLRGTESLGMAGKSGVSLLLAAMALAILQAVFGLLPFAGGFIASFFSVGAVLCALYGWIRIQEDFLERV